MTKALSIAELAAMAAEAEDQTVETTTTFDNEPPPAGVTIGRFIEYIEIGKHDGGSYQGKAKPDADYARLTFELLHPTKNIHEYEVEGEKRKRADRVSIRIAKKQTPKAKFWKLREAMTYGRDIKHMAQMLGEAFIITVYHNVVEKEGVKKTYVNLDKDTLYGITAPYRVDPITEERTDVPVPEAISPLRLFLFNNPTQETWDSLFIDGTREVKKDSGEIEHVSKNWLQESILSAKNFKGSALDALLGGVGDLPTDEGEVQPEEKTVEKTEEKTVAKTAAKTADKPKEKAAAKPAEKSKGAADDALAALGLV
ncbi:hypothetical protein UP09_03345 [Bradyrhizobium sp. LTSP885]|uniref:hypothetical protein n=1 Tax=Bradyrhizobium sp. LTSP885 TaxID=1619232 RepID=UPI0005CAA205|nr:hypothetical protein [Bradyrhizobium sp. LTSP885]KJC51090.1 hypothetical protein UP09_03345 [Bradyrhizobium sp. LTSP885]